MGLESCVRQATGIIREHEDVTIISHIDADGITSEAILSQAIAREEICVKSVFLRQLEPDAMTLVPRDDSLKIFTDLGAGQQNLLEENGFSIDEVLILDHHISQPCSTDYFQVNGLDFGHVKLSAAGITYLIARELNSSNRDLAKLGVIGNVGDMMARESGRLEGPASLIVEDGVAYGNVDRHSHDLNIYGISTRPLHIALSYCDDPMIPGISNKKDEVLLFLKKLGVNTRTSGGRWLVWEEISPEDKKTIINALFEQMIAHGEDPSRLICEHYIFPDEAPRTALRNASEYATMLNACGRWTKPHTGSAICRGDRNERYRDAEYMLRNHRSIIRDLMEHILEKGVKELSSLQYIHVGDKYPDTIVGIGAGMALSKLNYKKPILVMCQDGLIPERTKISMRTVEKVVQQGIDLQKALAEASGEFGGAGGGHAIAAGAFIPKTAEKEFVERVNRALEEQYA